MQADDVESSGSVKEKFLDMTLKEESRNTPSPENTKTKVNLGTFKAIQDGDYKLSEVNYEAEIEKIVPESSSSSEDMDIPNKNETSSNFLKSKNNLVQNESIRNWLQKISQMQTEIQQKLSLEQQNANTHSYNDFSVSKPKEISNTNPRVVKYQDLPYMGEITLDNSKPRRGRKPKKADICHLIYKNYGTIFPGTPNQKSLILEKEQQQRKLSEKDELQRTDVQNKIISSLLEKRLTQDSKLKSPAKSKNEKLQNEPLNLCVRDLNQLKIRLLRKSNDVYLPEIKSEPTTDEEDVEFVDNEKNIEHNTGLSNQEEVLKNNENLRDNFVYWPNNNVFIHPLALQQQLLYYQKLGQNFNQLKTPDVPSTSIECPENVSSSKTTKKTNKKVSTVVTEDEISKPKRSSNEKDKGPIKRKRSAIFIPPIPAENQNNPATEVSICKFKFTGGAKPSLQEKKMLSVDSGGNFRYYSGTGDKSMRGYEFFPRETLQQQISNAQGSSTGAFLQASGEKIHPKSLIDFTGNKANEFMLTPDLPVSLPRLPEISSRHKKRKSRKSLQREKLEQTFKEKGFLIQTQQLESAEGATYCKFRQLRKFTRYLFRSWKDYLPGNVTENQEPEKSDQEHESDSESFSSRLEVSLGSPSNVPTTI